MTAHPTVICIGDNCLDRYLPPVDRDLVGGSCANVAVALASQGVATAYFGAVGRDVAGERVLATLRSKNVDVGHVQLDEVLPTAITDIALTSGGERRFLREEYAINDAYSPPPRFFGLAVGARHIHATRLPNQLTDLRRWAVCAQATLSYDFSDHDADTTLDGLDIAFVSDPSDEPLRTIRSLHAAGVGCVVVLRGEAGSLASEAGTFVEMPGPPVAEVVDTCGAGDAFIGWFLASRLAGRTLRQCLRAGSEAGASTCAFVGAFPQ